MTFKVLAAGDPAPWFKQRSIGNPSYTFDSAAGRYIVLCFYGTASDARGRQALAIVDERRALFDDETIAFFGITVDPGDEAEGRIRQQLPGVRHFLDYDGAVSRLYGAAAPDDAGGPRLAYRRLWFVLDPTLRVLAAFPFQEDGSDRAAVADFLEALPPPQAFAGFEVHAPVLVLPNVFEPAFCRRLIALYEADGGAESGFMREIDGKTVGVRDRSHKQRSDFLIEDRELIGQIQTRIIRRVNPEIRKVHQFVTTRMERYLVGCYAADAGGHFRAHRDNTTRGTAHRRFAVSINLNADFEGGEVSFPEYGRRGFKPPPGGAVVFSCSLLHAVSRVTRGRRYAFLPFLYDDAAAKLREENQAFLDGGGQYRATPGAGA